MNDLQVHHLKKQLEDALSDVETLKRENLKLKKGIHNSRRDRSNSDVAKLKIQLTDTRSDLNEANETISRLRKSADTWRNKYNVLRSRVMNLALYLNSQIETGVEDELV